MDVQSKMVKAAEGTSVKNSTLRTESLNIAICSISFINHIFL